MDNDKSKALVIIDTELNEGNSQTTIWNNIQYFFEKGYDVIVKTIKKTDSAAKIIDEYGEDVDLVVCNEDEKRLDEVIWGLVKNGLNLPVWRVVGVTN